MKRIQVIAEFFRRRGAGGEFALLLALAALALLVAPSYPMVYGAGAVVAVLVMEAPFLNFRESFPSRTKLAPQGQSLRGLCDLRGVKVHKGGRRRGRERPTSGVHKG